MKTSQVMLSSLLLCACGGDGDGDSQKNSPSSMAGVNLETGLMCGDGFSACGGPVEGSWTLTGSCAGLDVDALLTDEDGVNPFEDCREQPTLELKFQGKIEITFKADGSYESFADVKPDGGFNIPLSCLEELGAACENLEGARVEGDQCFTEVPEEEAEPEMEKGTFAVKGGALTTTPDGGADPETLEFCVKGDQMVVFSPPEGDDDGGVYMVFRRR